jgi:hypothetical protein
MRLGFQIAEMEMGKPMWLVLENVWKSCRLLSALAALLAACGPGAGGTGAVASIAIVGPNVAKVGETLHLTAEAQDEKGALVSGLTFSWKSSNSNVATIANGDLRGVAVGRVIISAQSEGASVDALIAVNRVSPSSGPSSGHLIDAALAAHTIDEETAFKYKVFAAFGDARLPANLLGNDSSVFESSAVETLNDRFDSLSPATQEALGAFLLRPSSIGSWADPGAGSTSSHSIETSSAALGPGRPTCHGESSGWTTAGPSTAKVNVLRGRDQP